jgi:GrpB-like predicted nucleotidyltransferase (UPF0157 family)
VSKLAVGDFVREHPDCSERHAKVKADAADQSGTSMLGYQDRKREFVDELRAAALARVGEHG